MTARSVGLLIVSLFFASPLAAKDCAVSGLIADETGYVLPGATVVAVSTAKVRYGVVSDESGRYCFEDLPEGRYEVSVIFPGFEKKTVPREVTGQSTNLDFTLRVASVANAVTVTAMRGEERDAFEMPQSTSVVNREEILRRPSRILPDVLREEAGIEVQQTTLGQGSPFLRGMVGNRVLVLVDGIRFHNSTFRLGPIQYLATIDPATVERVEIVRGPTSVLYGSDALGGVINIIRRNRYYTDRVQTRGRFVAQFGSADLSGLMRAETTTSGRNFVLSLGGMGQKLNNLRTGGGRFGRSAESRFVTNNPAGSKGRQAPTGFEQYGLDASLRLRLGSDQELSLVYQRFQQFDVPRFDQLDGGNGNLLHQFDPQTRDLFYLDYQKTKLGFLDSVRTNISYQSQPETRRIQNISGGRAGDLIRDWSDTNTFGFMAQALVHGGQRHLFSFGGESYFDFVSSENQVTKGAARAVDRVRGRFPRDSRYRSYGLFAQDDYQFLDNLRLILGGRASAFRAQSPDVGVSSFLQALGVRGTAGLPRRLDFRTTDLTGNVGIVWTARKGLNLAFNVGRAFRAPNTNDLGSVGLTSVGFEVPSPNLKPESLIGYEFSTKLQLRRAFLTLSLFDSEIYDLIERRLGSVGGETTVAGMPVFERTNYGRARVLGFESSANIRISDNTLVWGNISHVSGRNISNGDYLSLEGGIPPTQGWIGWKWEPSRGRFWFEAYSQFATRQTRISGIPISMGGRFNGTSPSGDARDQRIGAFRARAQVVSYRQYRGIPLDHSFLPNGERIVPVSEIAGTLMFRQTDGFATLNCRGGYTLSEGTSVNFLLENLLDKNYRVHGSGIDAPGINLRVTYELRF